ncbi:hypothetical protein ACQ143_02415 [Microbacterium sp. MC2]
MASDEALALFLRALTRCSPRQRDAIAAGTLAGAELSATILRATDGNFTLIGETLRLTIEAWFEVEAGLRAGLGAMVLAGAVDAYPVAHVVEVRQAEGRPGALCVEVLCPYADLHSDRYRGHERHTHGWPASVTADPVTGSLGTRTPHCDTDEPGRVVYELILPERLRGLPR